MSSSLIHYNIIGRLHPQKYVIILTTQRTRPSCLDCRVLHVLRYSSTLLCKPRTVLIYTCGTYYNIIIIEHYSIEDIYFGVYRPLVLYDTNRSFRLNE